MKIKELETTTPAETIEAVPVNGKIIIKEDEVGDLTTASGLYIPATLQEKPYQGIVYKSDCKDYVVGDVILYQKYAGFNFELDKVSYLVIEPNDVLIKLIKHAAKPEISKEEIV